MARGRGRNGGRVGKVTENITQQSGIWGLFDAHQLASDGSWGVSLQPSGQALYTSPGSHTWTAPPTTSSVCVVCIGGGGGGHQTPARSGGGGGGGLGWKNDIPVVGGQSYPLVVGAPGAKSWSCPNSTVTATSGGTSYFISPATVRGEGGTAGKYNSPTRSPGGG